MNPQTAGGWWGESARAEHPNGPVGDLQAWGHALNPQTPLTSTEKESSGDASQTPKFPSPPQKKKVQVTLPEQPGRTDPRRAAGERR